MNFKKTVGVNVRGPFYNTIFQVIFGPKGLVLMDIHFEELLKKGPLKLNIGRSSRVLFHISTIL